MAWWTYLTVLITGLITGIFLITSAPVQGFLITNNLWHPSEHQAPDNNALIQCPVCPTQSKPTTAQVFLCETEDCKTKLFSAWESGKKLDLQAQTITSDEILDEIISMNNQGHKARVLLEKTDLNYAFFKLRAAGVEVREYALPDYHRLKQNFSILDSELCVTGSLDYSTNSFGSPQNITILTSTDCGKLERAFEEYWNKATP